jgi:NTP pyrophosphatase (non-canonical NTP hydrolase)
MNENQKSISDWAIKTFGYPTRQRSIDRMLEEVKELKDVKIDHNTDFYDVADECADIYITMCQIANTFGFDLHSCIDHKMEINRARKWKRAEDGTGQHEE